jgi:L-lactate dehydrogenase complex protein LldG
LEAAGGHFHEARDIAEATSTIFTLLDRFAPERALLGRGRVVDALALREQLIARGVEVVAPDADRDALFASDISITGVDRLIAETGTVLVRSEPDEPRSLSLLPPVHIAVADASQVTPDLFDLFDSNEGLELPSCLTLITGPSKTGDIELKLVTGVHGPGELHVVLIAGRLV